jgi:hypothetical protein
LLDYFGRPNTDLLAVQILLVLEKPIKDTFDQKTTLYALDLINNYAK